MQNDSEERDSAKCRALHRDANHSRTNGQSTGELDLPTAMQASRTLGELAKGRSHASYWLPRRYVSRRLELVLDEQKPQSTVLLPAAWRVHIYRVTRPLWAKFH
jgi:hypothetical protein